MAISIYPLFAAAERGVFLGLLTGWLAAVLLRSGKVRNLILTLVFGLVLYGVFQWVVQRGLLTNFMIYRFNLASLLQTGGTGRMNIWSVGLNIIKDHLMIGVGLGNFSIAYLGYAPSMLAGSYAYVALGPHSDIIGILTELGLIGLVLFIGLLLSVWVRFISLFRQPSTPEMTLLVTWLLGLWVYYLTVSLTSVLMYRKFYWILFALVSVVIKIYQERSENAGLAEQAIQPIGSTKK
jgi:O-antigen ligase